MAQKPVRKNYDLVRSSIPPEHDDLTNLDPRLYARGRAIQQQQRVASRVMPAHAAVGQARAPAPPQGKTGVAAPPRSPMMPPRTGQKPGPRPSHPAHEQCDVGGMQFSQEVERARIRIGGHQRLAIALSQILQRPIDPRTLFRWKLGQNLPPSTRICAVYNALRQV